MVSWSRSVSTVTRLKLALAVAFGLFIAFAGYMTWMAAQRQAAWRHQASYNTGFVLSQARIETARLHMALLALRNDHRRVSDVQLAFSILESRADVIRQGQTYQDLRDSAELRSDIGRLVAFVQRYDVAIDNLDASVGDASIDRMLADVTAIEKDMSQMVAIANDHVAHRIFASESEFEQTLRALIAVLAGLALCWVAMIVLLHWLQSSVRLLQAREVTIQLQSGRFEAALNNMSQALCMVDATGRPVVCNIRFMEMFGVAPDTFARKTDVVTVFGLTGHPAAPSKLRLLIAERQYALQSQAVSGTFLAEADGRAINVMQERTAEGGWVATYSDVTEARQLHSRMTRMALHDGLTGLPNRLAFREALERALADHRRRGDPFAVFYIDLDHFKDVNDTLGHPMGDALLIEVAGRLQASVRDADLVARLGGDEFAILQAGAEGADLAATLARRVIDQVCAPFLLRGHRVSVGTSVGIVMAPGDGNDADTLMKHADLALYRAKAEGRATHRFFDQEMFRQLEEQRAIEEALRLALSRGEMGMVYQPQINLETGAITGFEALIRWHSRRLEQVPPSRFIPIAEKIGLISRLGMFALREACIVAEGWPAHIRVAVNLSPVQFRVGDIVSDVAAVLAETGLPPERLELEITETVLLQDDAKVMAALRGLRELGARVALDDFGTGYSSPSYLLRFPFDKVKIDRCFVDGGWKASRSIAIVRSITSLAKELGIETTAEGVETADQLANMRAANCTTVQGFLVGRPMPVHAASVLVRPIAEAAD